MADRRGFLGRLLTFCGLAAVAPVISLPESPKRDDKLFEMKRFSVNVADRFIYKGFTIFWTGWKSDLNNSFYAGQWCAFEGRERRYLWGKHFYASYPGGEGQTFPGAVFDISWKTDQLGFVPGPWSSEEDLQRYKMLCLNRLMKLIDEEVPPSWWDKVGAKIS